MWNPTRIAFKQLCYTLGHMYDTFTGSSSVNGVGSRTSTYTCKYSMFTQTHTRWHMPLVLNSTTPPHLWRQRVLHMLTWLTLLLCTSHDQRGNLILVGNMNGGMPPTVLLSVSLRFGAKACKIKTIRCIFLCYLIKFKQPNVTLWVLGTVCLDVCKPHRIMIMSLLVKGDKDDSECTKIDT